MADHFQCWGTTFPLLGPFLCCCFLVLVGVVIWSAWKNRQQGWLVGLLFGCLLLGIPIWTMGAFYLIRWLEWL